MKRPLESFYSGLPLIMKTVLAKPGVHHQYSGKTIELGLECGKYCAVCTLAIINPSDSDIIRSMSEQTGEKQNIQL
ncbi:unnamed protein product [Nyctereutes procyonoides]|uniref:(raccoon dog) hypothetical protein n=1 Tax=Nyctereutes procyonoides TaxID=34880 RepID=A0A811Z6I6_NYCPR|nr:unnamed protein product [Nyctereutes procyonoides]